MSRIGICVLMGLPASGKTSFVHKLKEAYNNDQIIYHISYDDMILQFTREEDELKFKRKQIEGVVEELVKKIKDGLSEKVSNVSNTMSDKTYQFDHVRNQMKKIDVYDSYQNKVNHMIENLGKNILNGRENVFERNSINFGGLPQHVKHLIIIDDNMYYKSMRYSYFKISKENELSFCIIHFHVDLKDSLENNKKRTEEYLSTYKTPSMKSSSNNCIGLYPVTNTMIVNMNKKLEPPANEGFEKNHFITINLNGNFEMSHIKSFIDESFKTSLTRDKLPSLDVSHGQSFLQICDLVLRKIVSSHIEKFMKNNEASSQNVGKIFSTLDLAKTKSLPLKNYGEYLASIKKLVLKDIQNGSIHLESSEIGDSSRMSEILNEAFDVFLNKS